MCDHRVGKASGTMNRTRAASERRGMKQVQADGGIAQ